MNYVYWCTETTVMWGIVVGLWIFIPLLDSPLPSTWEAIDQLVLALAGTAIATVLSLGMY